MGEVLKYPLSQVLLSLANLDGSMTKNTQSKLLQALELRVAFVKPASRDAMIIDTMFFLHLLVDLPVILFNSLVYTSINKNYCINISIQKISSTHKFVLKIKQILKSRELKAMAIFDHAHPKIIESFVRSAHS